MFANHTINRTLATVICHTFIAGFLLLPAVSHARPQAGRQLTPYSMDVWANGDSAHFEVPRTGVDLGEGDLISGDINYEDLTDFFSQANVEVVDEDTIVLALPEGLDVDLLRIGDSGWWGLWGFIEECDGDQCGGYWGYLGTIVTDGFDLADEFAASLERHTPGHVDLALGPAAAVAIVAACVTVITIVSICAATDVEVSANAGPFDAGISC